MNSVQPRPVHSRDNTLRVPALDPSLPYSSRLSARSALFTELHILLDRQSVALSSGDYRALVIQENVLSRPTTSARTKLWKELKARYRLSAAEPLFAAFWDEWRRSASDPERALTTYVLLALNDRLVFDLGVEFLFPLLRWPDAELRVADVYAFIERAKATRAEVRGWSAKTHLAVAQKYLASIRDFGLAKGTARKTTVRPALYGSPVRLLISALRLNGATPVEILSSSGFRLLALHSTGVIDALGELNRVNALRFRMQGDVVELDLLEGQ